MSYPVAIKQAEKSLYLVVEDITELQEEVTEQTGGSKQSFYNNIDKIIQKIRQI